MIARDPFGKTFVKNNNRIDAIGMIILYAIEKDKA